MNTHSGDARALTRRKHQAMEAAAVLARVQTEFPDNPAGMRYFYDLFEKTYCQESAPSDKPVIGTTCVQIPDELIHAVGAVPVRLCNGTYAFDQAGAEFMPTKSCSLVKATLGFLNQELPGHLQGMRHIINATTCDQKTKAGQIIEQMGYDVHHLEVPRAKDSEESRDYWRRSVARTARYLEQATGRKLKRKHLKEAIGKVSRAQRAFRRLHALRKAKPSVIYGKDVFLITNAYFFDDIERWTESVEALNEELVQRVADGFVAAQKRAPRILFTGSPPVFPNIKLPLLIEQAGGVIVADETCSGNRMLYDAVSVDEWFLYDMVDAVADRYLKPCTCPIFSSNEDRRRRLLDLAQSFEVDGVIYQAFAGCQVYEIEQQSITAALTEAGVPSLYIETDYSPDDLGQLTTRVEAFIESLKSRRRRKK